MLIELGWTDGKRNGGWNLSMALQQRHSWLLRDTHMRESASSPHVYAFCFFYVLSHGIVYTK